MSRKLRVFLCHASQDKPAVRELYKKLAAEKWIEPWLDEENLLPGQDFDLEIYKATRDADAIIICLSKASVAKEGYLNKEIRHALDIAEEKPEGAIYVIPLRLDDCSPSFERLKKIQWVDYFTPNAHAKLIKSLRLRAETLKIGIPENKIDIVSKSKIKPKSNSGSKKEKPITRIAFPFSSNYANVDLDLYRFIQIPVTAEVPYSFYIGKYPVTNAQYERFLNTPDYSDATIWRGFLKFNEDCIQIGRWHEEGWDWFQEKMNDPRRFLDNKRVLPEYWNDQNLGISNPENPVIGISWFEANAYCNWLMRHWNDLSESRANTSLRPRLARLPLETEWVTAAGGETPENRFPWDVIGSTTTDIKEIVKRANIAESNIGYTTPVNAYIHGASPYGVMDMAGNVWERQMNYQSMKKGFLGLRGGSWRDVVDLACVEVHDYHESPIERGNDVGFRVAVTPSEHS